MIKIQEALLLPAVQNCYFLGKQQKVILYTLIALSYKDIKLLSIAMLTSILKINTVSAYVGLYALEKKQYFKIIKTKKQKGFFVEFNQNKLNEILTIYQIVNEIKTSSPVKEG
jgi:hypothetical protein